MSFKALYIACLLLTTSPLFASECDNDTSTNKNFSGSVQFGLTHLSGNTDQKTYNGTLTGNYLQNLWQHSATLNLFNDNNETAGDTSERYQLSEQTQYNYTEKKYTYFNTDFLTDSESGYDYIWNNSVGAGKTLYINEQRAITLDGQLGPGYRLSPNNDSLTDEQATANATLIFKWTIDKINSLRQDVNISYAQENTILTYTTAYTANLYKNFGIQAGLNVVQNTNVPENTEKVDTITTLNVLYTF